MDHPTHPFSSIEILDARIAPAVFFVSGIDLTLHKSNGDLAVTDATAATDTSTHDALLLHKGDSLVFDANNNHKLDKGSDYVMFSVKSGQAMVFFTDVLNDGIYEPEDFTGVAFGDGFKGALNGDLHGGFVSLLTPAGAFTKTTIQPSSLAGLTLNGHILGDVVAGKNITGITGKVPAGGDPLAANVSGSIYSGDSFNGNPLRFNVNVASFKPTYTPAANEAGGNISKLILPGGTEGISAGSAGPGSGKGGSISAVTLGGASDVGLLAGTGGAAATGVGGVGGDIVGVKVTSNTNFGAYINAGKGGSSANGAGGAGGKVSGIVLKLPVDSANGVEIGGGNGGAGGMTGTGGAGGAVEKSTFTLGRNSGDIVIHGGVGGPGGSGVAVGGKGGDITGVTLLSHGSTYGSSSGMNIYGGDGGNAGAGGAGSVGGAGGNLFGLKITADGTFTDEVNITGGNGGKGGTFGDGGRGGDLTKVAATFGFVNDSVEFDGGEGGDGGTTGGNGGDGGHLSNLVATNLGFVRELYAYAGEGGSGHGTTGDGGRGGDTTSVTFTNKGGANNIGIYSQNGGSTSATTGNGGDAGNLSKATINNLGFVGSGHLSLGAYYGGYASDMGTGNGGKGGNASNLKVNDTFGTTNHIYIYAGAGGNGAGAGGKGGDAGTLSSVVVNAPKANCELGYNYFDRGLGGTGATATGGNGGLITKVSGKVYELRVQAYPAGSADAGTGGKGGDIDGVKFTVGHFANIIMAGNGGDTTTGTPGVGGSVKNVVIVGDIGDFTGAFKTDISYNLGGMGGLIAGAGGKLNGALDVARNGSITNVSATRIAAIVAGFVHDNNLVAGNAVLAISKIKATVIGADTNSDGNWNYEEGNVAVTGFQFHNDGADTDDALLDGIVLVKTGGFTAPPVPPLKLIEV